MQVSLAAPALQRAAGRFVRAGWISGVRALPKHLNCGGSVRPCLQLGGPSCPSSSGLATSLTGPAGISLPVHGASGTHGREIKSSSKIFPTSICSPCSCFQCRVLTWQLALWCRFVTGTLTPRLSKIKLRHRGCLFFFFPASWKAHYVTRFSADPLRMWSQSSELILNIP